MNYHDNGAGLSPTEQTARNKVAGRQSQLVLAWFRERPGKGYTPFEVHNAALPRSPVTSVRRCLSDLTKAGFLEKTNERKLGKYGQLNNCWKLRVHKG